MGVDVIVQQPPLDEAAREAGRRVCRLEYDGDFVYLSAFWPQSSSNGHTIHEAISAGDAWFEGANLEQLRGCLRRARASLDGKPARWQEYVTTTHVRGDPAPRVRHDTVDREQLRGRIDVLLQAIDDAEGLSGRLLFYGE